MFGCGMGRPGDRSRRRRGGVPCWSSPFVGSFLGVLIRRLPEGRPIAWDAVALRGMRRGARRPRPRAAAQLARGCAAAAVIAARGSAGSTRRSSLRRWRSRWSPRPSTAATGDLARLHSRLVAAGSRLDRLRALAVARRADLAAGRRRARRRAGVRSRRADRPRARRRCSAIWRCGVVAYLYRKLRGRDGLGGGDAKLLAAAGAWVGASGLPQVVLIAALAGLVAAACLRLAGVRLGAALGAAVRTLSGARRPGSSGCCRRFRLNARVPACRAAPRRAARPSRPSGAHSGNPRARRLAIHAAPPRGSWRCRRSNIRPLPGTRSPPRRLSSTP